MPSNNQFTIATYNVQFSVNREKIIDNITQMAKDGVNIFCLQEIINVVDKEFIIDAILKRLGDNWKAAYHVGPEISKLSIGTAILWNSNVFTYKREARILLPKIEKFDLHEQLFYYIVGVPAIPLQRRAITCYFSFGQTDMCVTCVHVDNVGGSTHRMKQIAYLMSKHNSEETPKKEIICGDFNTFDLLKTGYEKKVLQEELGEDFLEASKDIKWTADIHNIDLKNSVDAFPWFIKNFNIHIQRKLDYMWVKNFAVKECKKLEMSGSDHLPIIATLELSESK